MIRKCEQSPLLFIAAMTCLLIACGEKTKPDGAVTESLVAPELGAAVAAESVPLPTAINPSSNSEGMLPQQSVSSSENMLEAEPDVGSTPGPVIGAVVENKFCEGFVSHSRSVEIPLLQKPKFLDAYIDPAFGSRVIKVTNSALGEVNKPAYSTMQAWNADESYLLLYRTGVAPSGHILLDGHTYEFIQRLDITPSDIEEVFWSRTNPDVFYYISKRSSDYGKLKQFSVSANRSTELANFSAYCGAGLPSSGSDVQMHSLNDDLFGFNCQQDDGHHIMFSFQPSTGAVVTAPIGVGSNWTDWTAPVPAPSGNRFWHQGFVIDDNLQTVVHQLDMANPFEHASVGVTHDGSDAYYQVGFNSSPNGCDEDLYSGVGHLIEHNIETGECRNVISEEQGYPYTTNGTHISAQAYLRPERVALSSIGRKEQFVHFANQVPAPALLSEVYVAQTTPSDSKVCRLAHHRSYGKAAVNGGYDAYFGEPHATISPTGTRVIYGSDWYDSGSVDSYVIELSDYARP